MAHPLISGIEFRSHRRSAPDYYANHWDKCNSSDLGM